MRKTGLDQIHPFHSHQVRKLGKNVLASVVGMPFFILRNVQIGISGEELIHVSVSSREPRILSDWKFGLGATHRCESRATAL